MSSPTQQDAAIKLLQRTRPRLLILSPPCTLFSQLQNLNPEKGTSEWMRKLGEARALLRYAIRATEEQVRLGGYFIFEHPLNASSWHEHSVLRVAALEGVGSTVIDQCAYGCAVPTRTERDRLANQLAYFPICPQCYARSPNDAPDASGMSHFNRGAQRKPRTTQLASAELL